MKKLVGIIIFIIVLLFVSKYVIVLINNNYDNNIRNDIIDNTGLLDILDVSIYDDYYIVRDSKYIYLFDSKYEEVLRIDNTIVHENKNNYDIVYRKNMLMYMDSYVSDKGIFFKYYDIYSYELIDSLMVGGN